MNRNIVLLVLVLAAAAAMLTAATNYVKDGRVVTLTWSSDSPSSGDACVKSQAKATGGIVGVALTGDGTASQNVSVQTEGIFNLSVTASSTVGNIAVGDYIFTTVPGINTHTCVLSNINSGLLFGQAMQAITASTTDSVFETIPVRLLQPSHL